MAVSVVVNAKVSRPSVCNSLDAILLHESIVLDFLTKSANELVKYKKRMRDNNNNDDKKDIDIHQLLKDVFFLFYY